MAEARRRVFGGRTCVPRAACAAARAMVETLELRRLLSAAADVTDLTQLRNDPNYAGVDGSGIGVAVIDTGAFAAHPDLRDNFVVYFDAVRDPSGRPGSADLQDAVDPDGHGTHTAGTAVSTNPEIGVATAADLIAIRGLPSAGDPNPRFDTVDNSLQWVLNNYQQYNIKVVNMSLGDYTANFNLAGSPPQIFQQLDRLGITLVISSGNNYANFAPVLGASSPGIYGTLNVANTWADTGEGMSFPTLGGNGRVHYVAGENDAAPDRLAATSQRSTLPNQVAAPGSNILSTWNDPSKLYNTLSGTSMSAPFVTGMVALMQDASFTYGGRYLTTAEVQQLVVTTAEEIVDTTVTSNFRIPIAFDSSGRPFRTGPDEDLPETGMTFKRVNVYDAVRAVRQLVTGATPDPTPDPEPDPEPNPDPDPIPIPTDGDTNNTIASAVVLPSLNGTRQFISTGNVGADGEVQAGPDDVDLYEVVLDSPGVVTFETGPVGGGTSFDAYLRLFSSAGAEIGSADDSADLYPTLRSVRLAAGTYYFGISSFNNSAYDINTGSGTGLGQSTGDYSLTVTLENPDPNGVVQGATDVDLANPDALNPNSGIPANSFVGVIDSDPNPITPDGPRTQIGPVDVDIYRVTAPDTGRLIIDVDAIDSTHATDGVDSYVRVFNAAVTEIGFNDDVGASRDSYLEAPVTAGEVYYVAVTTYGNRNFNPLDPFDRESETLAVGEYDLYLSFTNGDVDGTVFSATAATPGPIREGAIGSDNGMPLTGINGGAKDVDFYRFTAPDSGLLDVAATSPDNTLSPTLALWQYSAEQDDIIQVIDTAGTDARIIVPVEAGEELYVSVTGLGNTDFNWFGPASGSGGDTGNYHLASSLRSTRELTTLTDDSIVNGTPETLAPGEQHYRTIGVDGGVAIGAADVDLFRFVAASTGTITFRATVPGEASTDPFLRLFDEDGAELARNDDAADDTRDAALTHLVQAGQTYYVGVNGSSPAAGDYDARTGAGAAPGNGGDYVLEASQLEAADLVLDFTAGRDASYLDAGGQLVTVSLRGPGSGAVRFAGGSTSAASEVVLTGAGPSTTLAITAGAAGTSIGGISVDGSLKALMGKNVDLRGDLSIAGTVGKIQLRDLSGGTATIGAGGVVKMTARNITDFAITSASGIKAIKAAAWVDTDATPDVLSAPLIASIATTGNFEADIRSPLLNKARIGGALAGAQVRVGGGIGAFSAASINDSLVFVGVTETLETLPAALTDFSNPTGTIRSIQVRKGGVFSNSLIAAPLIGRATLGAVAPVPQGSIFGVAADFARTANGSTPAAGPFRLARADLPSDSLEIKGFIIRIL